MPEQARAPAAAAGDHGGAEATSAVVASAPGDASTSHQVIGAALRLVTTVTSESISQEEYEDNTGWLQCYGRKHGRTSPRHPMDASDAPSADHRSAHSATQPSHETKAQHQNRPIQRPRFPRLPKDDIKVVIRLRDGLNVARISEATLRDSILRAAGLEQELASTDIFRANQTQNIVVISTALLERAVRYTRIEQIKIGETTYATRAYVTPPENSVRGVIHNIPPYDSPEDIARSVVYSRNPTALHARRMGQTNSAIIPFSGSKVPYFVYYRGAEYRCYIHKKKHEVCSACGKLGHRKDVCSWPEHAFCSVCGVADPMEEEHECVVKCALCGKDHPTGDKQCKQRYRTPFVLKQRQWRRQRSRSQKRDSSRRRRDRSVSFPRLPPVDSSSQKNNNEKSSKPQRHSRSKSKNRNPDSAETAPLRQPCSTGTPDCTTQVSWSAKASQTARAGAQTLVIHIRAKQDNEQEELQSIRAILDQVLAENRHLKAELAQIKRSCTPATSSAGTPASHSFEENPPRSKRRAEEAADRPSQERHQMEQLEQRFKQGFEELQCAVNSLATALANFRETIDLKVTALEFNVAQLPSACTSSPTPPQQVGPIRSSLFPRGHGAPPYAEAVQVSAVQTASDHHGARTRQTQ
ncbi:hypothetical protein HPB48_009913 [Haemaphysalis longicornis]|uniref:CCHC-type domain-containing protein n=1 Tax=Haemaphysalis longicornis TaxID=44386 RepID=A0A9J6GX47_HAELO|nr:hypothetical protein HPB48_009913 [Haemaphysalis longicornis]